MPAPPACSRCGQSPVPHQWSPTPETARRGFGELRLCDRCVEALRSFLAQAKNPMKAKKLEKGQP
jgi:hypothetical protein